MKNVTKVLNKWNKKLEELVNDLRYIDRKKFNLSEKESLELSRLFFRLKGIYETWNFLEKRADGILKETRRNKKGRKK